MISDNSSVGLVIVWLFILHRLWCYQVWLSRETNEQACVYYREVHLFGNSGKDFHHSCQTKPVHPIKHFQQNSNSSDWYCNEYELCFHWFVIKNPFWNQHFDLGQNSILRGGQSIVDIDAADKGRLYVTTMKQMNFQDVIPSIPT